MKRQLLRLCLLLLVSLLIRQSLMMQFDEQTIVYGFERAIPSNEILEKIGFDTPPTVYHNGQIDQLPVIMLSGKLANHQAFTMVFGDSHIYSDRAVIAFDLAADLFGDARVVGQTISIADKVYTISGVVKQGYAIYIAEDDKLLNNYHWQTALLYKADKQADIVEQADKMGNIISAAGYRWTELTVNKDYSYGLISLTLLMLIGFAIRGMLPALKRIGQLLSELYHAYSQQRYAFLMDDFIKQHPQWPGAIGKQGLIALLMALIIVISISQMHLISQLLPGNFLSPIAYFNVLKTLYFKAVKGLHFGFKQIQIAFIIHFFIFIICGLVILMGINLVLPKDSDMSATQKKE